MVGHVDNYSVLVLELLHYLCHHRVVVQNSVVIVGKRLTLAGVQIGLQFLIVVAAEELALLRRTLAILHMLAQQMEYYEVVVGVLSLQLVVVLQQVLVVAVQLRVARVELRRAQLRVVQEEAATEVVHCLFSLRQKLVGDERYVVARLAEQFGEERIVAPFALVAHTVHREELLEDETREVPR